MPNETPGSFRELGPDLPDNVLQRQKNQKKEWVRDAAAGIVVHRHRQLVKSEIEGEYDYESSAESAVSMALAVWDAADKAFEGKV